MEEPKEDVDLWKHRRGLAMKSFYCAVTIMIAVLVFFFFGNPERIKAASEVGTVAIAMFGFFASIIGAYIGASAWTDKK